MMISQCCRDLQIRPFCKTYDYNSVGVTCNFRIKNILVFQMIYAEIWDFVFIADIHTIAKVWVLYT
jgi:hypothetical protein